MEFAKDVVMGQNGGIKRPWLKSMLEKKSCFMFIFLRIPPPLENMVMVILNMHIKQKPTVY